MLILIDTNGPTSIDRAIQLAEANAKHGYSAAMFLGEDTAGDLEDFFEAVKTAVAAEAVVALADDGPGVTVLEKAK